jgi:hypothetical protein
MIKLYEVGREVMLKGTLWSKVPPGYDPTPLSEQDPRGLGVRGH